MRLFENREIIPFVTETWNFSWKKNRHQYLAEGELCAPSFKVSLKKAPIGDNFSLIFQKSRGTNFGKIWAPLKLPSKYTWRLRQQTNSDTARQVSS